MGDGYQANLQRHETHVTYEFGGFRYCRIDGPNGKPKRIYSSKDAALDAADEQIDDRMLWPYEHHGHWHLTSNAPLLLPVVPYMLQYQDGPGTKKSQERHVIPYRKVKRKRFNGPHVLRYENG